MDIMTPHGTDDKGASDVTVGSLNTEYQKGLSSMENHHSYDNVLCSLFGFFFSSVLWGCKVIFAFSGSDTQWAVHCSRDSVVFPALTKAEGT